MRKVLPQNRNKPTKLRNPLCNKRSYGTVILLPVVKTKSIALWGFLLTIK